jgi:hypothetical protein
MAYIAWNSIKKSSKVSPVFGWWKAFCEKGRDDDDNEE